MARLGLSRVDARDPRPVPLVPRSDPAVVTFSGVDHVSLTVTDLDVSERFYTSLLGFVVVMDVGYGRICMHPSTGFVLALVTHPGAHGGAFSELHTGMDHLGLAAASREEL